MEDDEAAWREDIDGEDRSARKEEYSEEEEFDESGSDEVSSVGEGVGSGPLVLLTENEKLSGGRRVNEDDILSRVHDSFSEAVSSWLQSVPGKRKVNGSKSYERVICAKVIFVDANSLFVGRQPIGWDLRTGSLARIAEVSNCTLLFDTICLPAAPVQARGIMDHFAKDKSRMIMLQRQDYLVCIRCSSSNPAMPKPPTVLTRHSSHATTSFTRHLLTHGIQGGTEMKDLEV